jgi:hypothetical protein
MAELPGEHRDLPAVMGIVCDQVPEKSGHIRTKAFDLAISCQGLAQN